VQRGQPHAAPAGDVARHGNARWPGFALGKHRPLELVARETALRAEHGDVEILVERDAPRLEIADRLLVTILKIVDVDAKSRQHTRTLLAIPAVRAQHPADV